MKKDLKIKALELRKRGYSIKELRNLFDVSKSTISLWVRNVELSQKAEKRLRQNYTDGQLASQKTIKEKTRLKEEEARSFSDRIISGKPFSKELSICMCAMIWWCEGGKRSPFVFTNSDPELVQCFLNLFRKSFDLDEQKFRVLMHLHDYHNEDNLRIFWSKTTKIPIFQFHRSYLKESKHVFKKEGYMGCIRIQYNDVSVFRKMSAVAKGFMKRYK